MSKLPDEYYWRYKKKKIPVDEYSKLNGPVKVVKPKAKYKKPFNQKKWDNYQKYKTLENDNAILEQLLWIKTDR